MSLPPTPPSRTASVAALREGSNGWPVYALQTGLNAASGSGLTEDGAFGPATRAAVTSFQRARALTTDGIAGPATKAAITDAVAQRIDAALVDLPNGLIRELCRAEGGDNISAVNDYDPPTGTRGTDCGIVQLRCSEPYTLIDLMRAFDPHAAMREAARRYTEAKTKFLTYGWARNNRVRAERLALLSHNWPVGANDIAFDGKLYNPDGIAAWVPEGVRMLDGTVVTTRQGWCDFYAMGTAPHCGAMAARVRWGV